MAIDRVSKDTAPLFEDADKKKPFMELLWGDRVEVLVPAPVGGRAKVKARGQTGFVPASALGGKALLEIYFIDVGQGDGVLVCTPDGRHVLIDGGYDRTKQPTGKNAADFVDWKFKKDYGRDDIHLNAMVSSHCDADHYGGLRDLVDPEQRKELDTTGLRVDAFYHSGIGWWKNPSGDRKLGEIHDDLLVTLLGNRPSAKAALKGNDGWTLQGEWAEFMRCLTDLTPAVNMARIGDATGYLPGFEPSPETASIRVLGPVERRLNDKPALPWLGSESQTTNGNSVLLRVDYGRTRVLLTGDLNAKSQQLLLQRYEGRRLELACDVAKACHHGSDDASWEFLSALGASATVISSGDCEGHGHPRPSIVAASALAGHRQIHDDRVVTPLVYSTEIARSVRIGDPFLIEKKGYETPAGKIDVNLDDDDEPMIHYSEVPAGAVTPRKRARSMKGVRVVSGIVYGLVNVRTDGDRILCATLNEQDATWDVKTFRSRL